MKCLTLILPESAKQDLIDFFQQLPEISGYTFIRGEGHSQDTGRNPFETNLDRVVGYVPRTRVDLILPDPDVDKVLQKMRSCESCSKAIGLWWVSPVEGWGHL